MIGGIGWQFWLTAGDRSERELFAVVSPFKRIHARQVQVKWPSPPSWSRPQVCRHRGSSHGEPPWLRHGEPPWLSPCLDLDQEGLASSVEPESNRDDLLPAQCHEGVGHCTPDYTPLQITLETISLQTTLETTAQLNHVFTAAVTMRARFLSASVPRFSACTSLRRLFYARPRTLDYARPSTQDSGRTTDLVLPTLCHSTAHTGHTVLLYQGRSRKDISTQGSSTQDDLVSRCSGSGRVKVLTAHGPAHPASQRTQRMSPEPRSARSLNNGGSITNARSINVCCNKNSCEKVS
jgi:hypothetical protein